MSMESKDCMNQCSPWIHTTLGGATEEIHGVPSLFGYESIDFYAVHRIDGLHGAHGTHDLQLILLAVRGIPFMESLAPMESLDPHRKWWGDLLTS